MPHYDYSCASCGHEEEIFQKMSEQPLVDCPACHQAEFKRKPGGGSGLHFKGSGFYITDYNNTPSKPSSGGCCPCGSPSSCSSNG
ncbi:conserved hypothetical protein [Candidatus Protochlamydia naegleriophila]|uniref:Putative regulatory protein FmdB zinc ribbon domain-containing protein n=1 Tax=Candidatus Protochlamydia naegleriophila TaxID=389348 RepID=A0A0U5K6W7_9BACT|nr:zinc ribbon domain-containing protein [Candidatus Protochlamydia naegleriophila]CUI17915.1 conserved hypothetical protein [Candidatus Protochlamydia naegleriophila]